MSGADRPTTSQRAAEGVVHGKPPIGRPAVVLLSGGLDSTTVLAIAKSQGFACHTLTFDYGQRHRTELVAAKLQSKQLQAATHRVATIDLRSFGHSALTDNIAVPKDRDEADMGQGIPVTYVPARNTIFLSYALALAEVVESSDIFIGVNSVDYSGYPDCRPQYIEAFARMAALATKAGVEGRPIRIHTPLIDMTKVQIVEAGLSLGVDFALTHSCYDPADDPTRPTGARSCGHCDACLLRRRAFAAMGKRDPLAPDDLGQVPGA